MAVLRDLSRPVAPVAKTEEKREYYPIDMDTAPKDAQDLYNNYRKLRLQAAEAREAFETAMNELLPAVVEVPAGKEIGYWYNFGQLNISFEAIRAKKKAAKVNAITFK